MANTNKEEVHNLMQTLPRIHGWGLQYMCQYQGYWFPQETIENILILQKEFEPQPSNIILASFPKSGTTWLKALLFTIIHRNRYDYSVNPLLTMNPHECMPWMEYTDFKVHLLPILRETPLLSTHIPYTCLPKQILKSKCPIIYICRNPKDVVVSSWSYFNKLSINRGLPCLALEDVVARFCDGTSPFGPYWDHLLGYWKASLEFPQKVLILMYEDLKRDPLVHVQRLAKFIGYPFSLEEERGGEIQKVIQFCSFENLSTLTVNKEEGCGTMDKSFGVTNNMFFRKGEVGDNKNHLTEIMVKRLEEITEHKLQGSGFRMPI